MKQNEVGKKKEKLKKPVKYDSKKVEFLLSLLALHSKVSGLSWEEDPLIPISQLGQLLCFGDIANITEYEIALSSQQFSNPFQDLICYPYCFHTPPTEDATLWSIEH